MKVRGGSSIGSLSNWLFNSIVVWTFFKVIKVLPACLEVKIWVQLEFLFICARCRIGLVGIKFLPETKGMSLEDIEKALENGGNRRFREAVCKNIVCCFYFRQKIKFFFFIKKNKFVKILLGRSQPMF